jgi:hypothetical protein
VVDAASSLGERGVDVEDSAVPAAVADVGVTEVLVTDVVEVVTAEPAEGLVVAVVGGAVVFGLVVGGGEAVGGGVAAVVAVDCTTTVPVMPEWTSQW